MTLDPNVAEAFARYRTLVRVQHSDDVTALAEQEGQILAALRASDAAATPDAVLREAVTATETCDLPDNDCGCYDADGDPKCDKCRRADITRKLESAAPILRRDLSARVAELEARWDNLIESVIGALRLDEDDVDTDLAREHPFETLCVIVNETADKALRVEQAEAKLAEAERSIVSIIAEYQAGLKEHDRERRIVEEERDRYKREADAMQHAAYVSAEMSDEIYERAERCDAAEARGAALGKALDGLWAKVERWQKAHDALGGGDTPEERERILDEADSAESTLLAARPDAAKGEG